MVKERRSQEKAASLTMEEWRAKFREQYRPSMVELVAAFDNMPRRPDEDEWRAALVEELLDLLQVGVEGDVGGDMTAIEAHLMATLRAVQSRVHQAVEEHGAGAGS